MSAASSIMLRVVAGAASARTETGLAADILQPAEMRGEASAWRELFHACAEANPFYGPDFLLPLLALDGRVSRVRFVLVRHGPLPIGLLPFLAPRFAVPGLPRRIAAYGHPFVFNHLPLLRAGHEAMAGRAVLGALAARYGDAVLSIGSSPLDGPPMRGLLEMARQNGHARLVTVAPERAAIVDAGDLGDKPQRIKGKVMGKLRRNERELGKIGALQFSAASSGEALARAVEKFLALEGGGWKGRQGTALISDPASAAFARQALGATQGAPAVRIELMELLGRPIGALVHLVAPGYAATFKTAYEEELARRAPGVMSCLFSLRGLAAERWATRLDSGASGEDAVGAVWPDRLASAEVLLALTPHSSQAQLERQARAAALLEQARRALRDLVYRLTRRKRTRSRH